jgi:hypothetical protein
MNVALPEHDLYESQEVPQPVGCPHMFHVGHGHPVSGGGRYFFLNHSTADVQQLLQTDTYHCTRLNTAIQGTCTSSASAERERAGLPGFHFGSSLYVALLSPNNHETGLSEGHAIIHKSRVCDTRNGQLVSDIFIVKGNHVENENTTYVLFPFRFGLGHVVRR